MDDTRLDTGAVLPRPNAADLKEAETAVRLLQQMLGNLHANKEGKSDVFQEFMEHYKHLSTTLQEVRKIYQVQAEEQARLVKASQKPATGPPSVLGRAGRLATSTLATPDPRLPSAGSAASTPVPGRPPPSVSAQSEPFAGLPEPAVARPAPAGITETLPIQPDKPVAGLPLALPKFVSTLGPAGSKAISKGPEVQRLNQLLAVLGYDVAPTETYEMKTFRAVNEFQKTHRLAVNGVVGLETRKALNERVTG